MADYQRPAAGFRFEFGGLKTNSSPDAVPPNKYNYVQNVRSLSNNSVRTRPGSTLLFAADTHPITDIGSYSALSTDNLPRFLARDSFDGIWLDNSTLITAMAGAPHPLGVSMIPFRPNQSPVPYLYIANGSDYQKFSAPSAANVVTRSNAGIAEPQSAPISCPDYLYFLREDTILAAGYAAGGTAGAPADLTRSTEVIAAGALLTPSIITDPGSNPSPVPGGFVPVVRSSVVTDGTQQYQIGQLVDFTGAGTPQSLVQDVIPALTGALVKIATIQYVAGATGNCSIVTAALFAAEFLPSTLAGRVTTNFQTTQVLLAGFKRGAIIQFTGGVTENVFLLSATEGPDGNISLECSTQVAHGAGEVITILPTIVLDVETGKAGSTISSRGVSSAIGAGTGTITATPFPGPLTTAGLQAISGGVQKFAAPIRPDDYFHISFNVSDPTQLATTQPAIRVMFDVNNGAANFTDNFYYFEVSASDLTQAVAGTQTQLGATVLSAQRQILRGGLNTIAQVGTDVNVAPSLDIGPPNAVPDTVDFGSAGEQTTTGLAQWTEVFIPLTNLTRVGNDSTRTMLNVQSFRIQIIATGGVTLKFSSGCFLGGAQPDTGQVGAPYLYRVVPKSSATGAKGNPSPATRYGVVPKRQQVVLTMPSSAYDSQIDTWDVERYGGTVLSFRYIGSGVPGSTFVDKVFDDAAQEGDLIEFDNFQPWPSIDLPFNGIAPNVAGTLATLVIPSPTNALRWLPGTQVRLGNLVYTLFNRPTLLFGNTYLVQFIENAGTGTNVSAIINEPIVGNQKLPYMWGPDAAGTIFGVGDPLRPGTISFCKSNNPDSCPDKFNLEITSPSEPLLGGETVDGLSYVASPERWWALYPNVTNPNQRYAVVQQPVQRGLAAPFGHCTDGQNIYFWAKDGIWSTGGRGSLTDEDLYNLFPHEGVPGRTYTYGAFTIQPPDYSKAGTFRLAYCNYYLFADYQDSAGTYHTLVFDTRRNAWCVDVFSNPTTVHYHPPQQEGTVLSAGSAYPMLLMGKMSGTVHQETDGTNDNANLIQCAIGTMEWNGGDARAGEQWGDMILDCFPAAQGVPLTATPVVLGVQAAAPNIFTPSANRTQEIVSLGGQLTTNYLGLLCTWTDDFSKQATATRLEIWQPSFVHKPETIADRITDWYSPGGGAAVFIQGFRMRADTANVVKAVVVRDADTLALHPFTPIVQHNGEQTKAYSFNAPFIAHMVRLESQDFVPWRLWDAEVEWIVQPTPEQAETWITQATAHGITGYMHIARIMAAWASTAPVTLTITSFDGQSPAPITLPSTGGQFQKQLFTLTPNKGVLYTYSASCANPCQIFWEDFEIHVGAWRRQEGYMIFKNIGGNVGNQARI